MFSLSSTSITTYTSGNDTMACNVCRRFIRFSDPKSSLVLGTNKLRKYPLYKHEKSTCQTCYK